MDVTYNFSAGPAAFIPGVVADICDALTAGGAETEYGSDAYRALYTETADALRALVGIPQNYRIIFMPGGSSVQYSAVPMNLLTARRCADYVVSGRLSKSACLEAKKYGDIAIAASSAGANPVFSTVPETKRADFRPDADYVHICFNNPIYGTKFHYIPDVGNLPLVADMTACLLSEPVDVSKFGVIYADGMTNIGAPGMSVVIIREDLLGNARADIPAHMNYKLLSEGEGGCPPALLLMMAKRVFERIASVGGLEEMKRRNERKACLLYDYFDTMSYYTAPIDRKCRSMTNIVFVTGDAALDRKFITEARECGLINLMGDPSVGGMRASLYNSMPYEGVEALLSFMRKFSMENPKF